MWNFLCCPKKGFWKKVARQSKEEGELQGVQVSYSWLEFVISNPAWLKDPQPRLALGMEKSGKIEFPLWKWISTFKYKSVELGDQLIPWVHKTPFPFPEEWIVKELNEDGQVHHWAKIACMILSVRVNATFVSNKVDFTHCKRCVKCKDLGAVHAKTETDEHLQLKTSNF